MRVFALVTVYFPSSNHIENIKLLSKQVEQVYICDNSKKNNEKLFFNISNSVYVYNEGNKGLSAAFNKLLKSKLGEWKEEDKIIFFDQDSKIGPHHIENLCEKFSELEKKG